jgi:hypothetical protein
LIALLVLLFPAASAETTLSFKRLDHQHRGPGIEQMEWHALVTDRAELNQKWDRYQMSGEPPRVGFAQRVGIFAGTGGSSSCPLYVHDVQLRRARDRIVVRLANRNDDNGCTDDWRASTFLLSITKKQLPSLEGFQVQVGRAR